MLATSPDLRSVRCCWSTTINSVHDASQVTCELLVDRTTFIVLQVLYDVASGIGNAAKKDIAHRDVTPNNFGHWEGRGYLFDFSAAKVSSTSDGAKC